MKYLFLFSMFLFMVPMNSLPRLVLDVITIFYDGTPKKPVMFRFVREFVMVRAIFKKERGKSLYFNHLLF